MTSLPIDPPLPGVPTINSQPKGPEQVPPHPLDGEWFIHLNGDTYGPYSGHRLGDFVKEGRIDGATQVLSVGTEEWVHASEDRRLASLFRPTRQASQLPPPITAASGATVVQVTNQIAPQPVIFMEDGLPFGPKSPGIALLLSFLWCGAGQMYCGRVGKGILMMLGAIALWFILLGWIIQIWSMVDAYQTAKQMNLRYMRRLQLGQAI
ncbi:GYF domain-containing protein [Bradyrhizobium sp. S3.2.12]|uniref:GYF domain-containing protein n=1 Tax=Bradyrhizobium sp. S3.2.12 TaxID=3156387 RepID=UPI0033976910